VLPRGFEAVDVRVSVPVEDSIFEGIDIKDAVAKEEA